jgi:hypothetical protein
MLGSNSIETPMSDAGAGVMPSSSATAWTPAAKSASFSGCQSTT